MHYLESLLETVNFPIITALLLGIITSIHPCPLTLNITAIGYISRDLEKKSAVFLKGLTYTLGRVFTYTVITLIIYFGADELKIGDFFHEYGEILIGPFLIIMGIIMLDVIPFKFTLTNKVNSFFNKRVKHKHYGPFLLGCAYALVFCPHTVALYFGFLVPLTLISTGGLFLPAVFAVGTGLPVVLVSWILTYSLSSISGFYSNLKIIEKWIRIITAIIFIFAGLYFIFESIYAGHVHDHTCC